MKTRKGLATLEFVICLPLIASMTAVVFWLGHAATQGATADTQSRGDAWSQRSGANPGDKLALDAPADTGSVRATASRRTLSKPFSMTMTSTDATIFNEWTFEDVEFKELNPAEESIEIHGEILKMLVNANPRTLSAVQPVLGMLGGTRAVDPRK